MQLNTDTVSDTDYSDIFLLFPLYSTSFTVVHIVPGISLKHTPGSLLPIHCIPLMHPERDSHITRFLWLLFFALSSFHESASLHPAGGLGPLLLFKTALLWSVL